MEQLYKSSVVLASVSKKNLPELKRFVKKQNRILFSIYLDVPLEQRIARLIKRKDSKDKEYIKNKILNGVGYVKPTQRKCFDRVYKNQENKLTSLVNKIYKDIKILYE